ncbi:MAG: MerR family transcriptional regulator [Eubacteriales bacterium]|nr:MerR family transcriptional regulator [Eubacteriales bacterium]
MMTVNEVSKLAGVSIRTLQYYDKIGLLHPAGYTDSGYRLYDDAALERLQQILLFRELEFPLKQIKEIISAPDFDRNKALEQQIAMLQLKKEHLENLITFARGIQWIGVKTMDFSAFDTSKLDEYVEQAKKQWGTTDAYKEFENKSKGRTAETENAIAAGLMLLFEEFGKIRHSAPDTQEAQRLVKRLQGYITEHYYHCTPEILTGLGKMYAGGGAFTENIDTACGDGTAAFVADAIDCYCKNA